MCILNLVTRLVELPEITYGISLDRNRPWWPSGLSRYSNSSRVSAADPGLNPAQGVNIHRVPSFYWPRLSHSTRKAVPHIANIESEALDGSRRIRWSKKKSRQNNKKCVL